MAVHHDKHLLPQPVEHKRQRQPAGPSGLAGQLLVLQRAVGNRATVQLLRTIAPAGGDAGAVQREDDDSSSSDQSMGNATDGQLMEVREDVEPTPDSGITTDSGDQIAATDRGSGMGDFPTNDNPDTAAAAPEAGPSFVSGGRTGTIRWGDTPLGGNVICAHAFAAGGMIGTTPWGPAGAVNNQSLGSIQSEVVPNYQAQPAAPPVAALAWVQNGTGTMQVTRSYTGVNAGNQGNGYFVTPAAAARINQHEVGHVNSTKGFHDSDLKPMLDNILGYTQAQAGRGAAADQPTAIAMLQATLNMPARWIASKWAFSSHDTTANQPNGSFDTADLASGTYPVDIGPGTVAGTAFTHRIKTPAEPAPV